MSLIIKNGKLIDEWARFRVKSAADLKKRVKKYKKICVRACGIGFLAVDKADLMRRLDKKPGTDTLQIDNVKAFPFPGDVLIIDSFICSLHGKKRFETQFIRNVKFWDLAEKIKVCKSTKRFQKKFWKEVETKRIAKKEKKSTKEVRNDRRKSRIFTSNKREQP